MDISIIYKIAGIGIIVSILNVFLNQAGKSEQAHLLNLAGVVLVLLWLVQMVGQLFNDVATVFRWW